MPYEARTHQPGDLIPSDEWNAISAAVAALEGRVTVLENRPGSGLEPVVSGRDPQGDVAVGSRLTVLGHNFLVPADQNTVTLDSAAITQFLSGSDDEHLTFSIPDGFTGLPRTLTLVVSNRNGSSAPMQVRVLGEQTSQGGRVVFLPQTATGQTPQVGDQVEFQWDVDSQTVVPERYQLNAVFTNADGAAAADWLAAARVEPDGITEIARGAPLRATLTVDVPAGAQSVDVALEAVAQDHAELTRTSDALHVEVGEEVTPSDPRTVVTLRPVPPLDDLGQLNAGREATIGGASGVEVQFGHRAYLQVGVHFTEAGKYRFSAAEEGDAGWTTDFSPKTATVTAGKNTQLDVGLTAPAAGAAATPGLLAVTATKRNAADTADDFVSYVRIPVRGYAP